jgi:hypothetical protein
MATELRNGLFSQRYPTMAVDAFSASHTCFKLNASRPASSARRLASYRCLAASSALAARAARIDGSRRQYRMVGGDYLLGIRLTSCWPPAAGVTTLGLVVVPIVHNVRIATTLPRRGAATEAGLHRTGLAQASLAILPTGMQRLDLPYRPGQDCCHGRRGGAELDPEERD